MDINSVAFLLTHPFGTLPFEESLTVVQLGRSQPDIAIENFRIDRHGKRTVRRFRKEYYTRYNWITGCTVKNKLFCFPCLLFSTKVDSWSRSGYDTLNNLSKDAKKHEKSLQHKVCVKALARFGKEPRIDCALSSARAEEIKRHNEVVSANREVLKIIIECVLYLAIHELPFRGHDEGEHSLNRGNFKDLLTLIAKTNPLLNAHMQTATVWKGDSLATQNEIISCIAEEVREAIRAELAKSTYFAIEADDTTDVATQEKLVVVARYIAENRPVERFLCFKDVSGNAAANGIATKVLEAVQEFMPTSKKPILVGQTYDGASTMAGKTAGVQQLVQREHPKALFIHCYAHRLNLVLKKLRCTY